MSLKPSVKDFVLMYFDRLGATVNVEDEIYTVTPPADLADEWPFADPFVFSFSRRNDEEWTHIALGSPVLKQIIEIATSRGKVTGRHLVASSVPTIGTFHNKLAPTNGSIKSFTFVGNETVSALCFAHLITYDAPAFGKCEAEIQLDVLDAVTGDRDSYLSDKLFDLVTIPHKPEMGMEGDKVDWLHERARYLSNYRSEKKAKQLEDELKLRWQTEEKRINSYYDQLNASIKEKEVGLVSRIETLEGKLGEAKAGTAAKEKLQAELDLAWQKLRDLNASVEEQQLEIEEGRSGKLAAEKARHELSVRSELVNVSFLAYDAVTFKVTIAGPGVPAELEVRYLPIKDTIEVPPCPHCGRAISGLTVDASGHVICAECNEHCPRCSESLCPECRKASIVLGSCKACYTDVVLNTAPAAPTAPLEPVTIDAPAPQPEPATLMMPKPHLTVAMLQVPPSPQERRSMQTAPVVEVQAQLQMPTSAQRQPDLQIPTIAQRQPDLQVPTVAQRQPELPMETHRQASQRVVAAHTQPALPTTSHRAQAPQLAAEASAPARRSGGSGHVQFPFERAPRAAQAPAKPVAKAPSSIATRPGSISKIDLPKPSRPKMEDSAYARVESRSCPHCSGIVLTALMPCSCCGISVCTDCVAPGSRACQTCSTLGVPRQEPAWVRLAKAERKDLAKVKRYHVSANERYGVIHWQGFAGDRLLVFDLWQKKVVAERRGNLLRSLRPKALV